jgi:hypothetical protein
MTGKRTLPIPEFKCLRCGRPFLCLRTNLPKHGRKYCSISCSAKSQPHPRNFGKRRFYHGYYALKRDGRYVPEHRLVMEAKIGRKLFDCENVHHINGQKLDNRPENLEIWNTKQPKGQRVFDKVEFALEILRMYPTEAVPFDGILSSAA